MSAIDPFSTLSAYGSIGSMSSPGPVNGLPVVNQADEPAAVRAGGKTAQSAYDTGLDFESILVNQLTTELTATAGLSGDSGDDSDDGSDDGSDDTGMGSDPATAEYAQLLPGALTSSIMSDGGLGVAMPIAEHIDPALMQSPAPATSSAAAAARAATAPGAGTSTQVTS